MCERKTAQGRIIYFLRPHPIFTLKFIDKEEEEEDGTPIFTMENEGAAPK